jgi:hypothetical protein
MQDKGHATMLKEFLGAIQAGTPSPIALDELALTSLATFAVVEAVEMGKSIVVNLTDVTHALHHR